MDGHEVLCSSAKATEGNTHALTIQALHGNVEDTKLGLVVPLGDFSMAIRKEQANLRLINGKGPVDLVLDRNERIDWRDGGSYPSKANM